MKYDGDFKLKVVLDVQDNKLGFKEAQKKYEITDTVIARWERIYLEEGREGLYIERRGRSRTGKGRKPSLSKSVNEDLIAENQRLRMENEYLKKLRDLVRKREQDERKKLK